MGTNKYIKVEYDNNKTILQCDQCKNEEIEWYNTQPGDPCQKVNCKGRMFRVLKKLIKGGQDEEIK